MGIDFFLCTFRDGKVEREEVEFWIIRLLGVLFFGNLVIFGVGEGGGKK